MSDKILFAIVNPEHGTVICDRYKDATEAVKAASLQPGQVDHGTLTHNLAIIVYEFSLKQPPHEQHFFRIGHNLYAGNAVLYSYNEMGETVDLHIRSGSLSNRLRFKFYQSIDEIESDIATGELNRPQMSVNGEVLWQWNV
jgi:hypothetical protein